MKPIGAMQGAALLVVASSLAMHVAWAQLAGTKRTDLQRHDLSIPGREAIQVVVELAPGVLSPKHTHPKNVGTGNAASSPRMWWKKGSLSSHWSSELPVK